MNRGIEKICGNYMTPAGIARGNDPYLYGEKVKAYLIRGARHFPILQQYPNPQLGDNGIIVSS